MKVWLVWTDEGEYESYFRDLQGVFQDKELAEAHAAQVARKDVDVDIEETEILTDLPYRVMLYEWADCVLVDGSVSPDWRDHKDFGKTRSAWPIWSHEVQPLTSQISFWHGERSGKPDLYIKATGANEDEVKAEYAKLLVEARRRLGL